MSAFRLGEIKAGMAELKALTCPTDRTFRSQETGGVARKRRLET